MIVNEPAADVLSQSIQPPIVVPMNKLAPEHIDAETLGNILGSAFLAVPSLVGLLILGFVEGWDLTFFVACGAFVGLLVLLGFSSLVWPRIAYRHASWRLDDQSLEIHRGVLWKHRIAVPLGRVQHADVAQGPMLRYFGLGKLIIHTAGSSHATIELSGLTHGDAVALRDRLVQQTQSKNVL